MLGQLSAALWDSQSRPDVIQPGSSVAKKNLVKLPLAQNRVARLALHCNQGANINTMHASLSWLTVEEILTETLFIRNIVLEIPKRLHRQLTHSTDTYTYPTMGLFTVPRPRTNGRKQSFKKAMELPSI
jgi:hypothetical protein